MRRHQITATNEVVSEAPKLLEFGKEEELVGEEGHSLPAARAWDRTGNNSS